MSTTRAIWMSALAGFLTLCVVAGLSSVPHLDMFAFLWLPGAFMAALLFPQGIEGDYPVAYVTLSALLDVSFYSVFAYLIHFRRQQRRA